MSHRYLEPTNEPACRPVRSFDAFRIELLIEEWHSLSDDEQDEVFDDFREACLDGGREPSEYWYPLLMPWVMSGYVGD